LQDIETWNIAGGTLEYVDETHTYIFNGEILPSITQILKVKFGNKYDGVSYEVLKRASELGTNMHQKIQDYEEHNINDVGDTELQNYRFLKKHYKWEVEECEVPIVLIIDGKPIGAGRLDLLVKKDDKLGILDLKRTSVFDKEYVAFQTNLYRLGFQSTYNRDIELIGGIHLRESKRKYYELPINENMAISLLNKYLKEKENE
jgi:hypothetical protein